LAAHRDRSPTRRGQPRQIEHRAPPARRDLAVDEETGHRPARPDERKVAVALSHDMSGPGAPRVVATGWGETARKILETAFANNVKVREDPDLARILAAVEVDCEIPLEAFTAVAEILAYVYRANGRLPPPGGASSGGASGDQR